MYILGISTMTESSAALMSDGKVVAAAEEERFSRVKHQGGFPFQSISYVLDSQGITLADVDHLAVYWNPYVLGHRIRFMINTCITNPSLFMHKLKRATSVWGGCAGEKSGWSDIYRTRKYLSQEFEYRHPNVHFLDHHECHIASCHYPSPFEESAVLIMDGAGEAACTTWAVARGSSYEKLGQVLFPHSLGHFYSAITGYLGFKMLDGEYKLMGLSPYGDSSGADWMREHVLPGLGEGRYKFNTGVLDYHRAMVGSFNGPLVKHFGAPRPRSDTAEFNDRHRDIAASAQKAFEAAVHDLCVEVHNSTGLKNLTIAGGCGLNCTANGKMLHSGLFEQIYVPSVPHDSGAAMGAAMLLYAKLSGKRPDRITHAQFGPSFSDQEIEQAISSCPTVNAEKCTEETLLGKCVEVLTSGGVIAWFQGRMEYGPRALGNRSFLADPRSDSIRDTINEKIKKRELFRPFAPSVKEEKAGEYFDINQPSPFMTIIVPVRKEKQQAIPAVTHVDGTARPQTVAKGDNPRYWSLLDRFESATGVPVLLNTSFNIQEPIVCAPEEALATFSRSGVDALAIGDFWVTHKDKG